MRKNGDGSSRTFSSHTSLPTIDDDGIAYDGIKGQGIAPYILELIYGLAPDQVMNRDQVIIRNTVSGLRVNRGRPRNGAAIAIHRLNLSLMLPTPGFRHGQFRWGEHSSERRFHNVVKT
jgi:hypothetical protein